MEPEREIKLVPVLSLPESKTNQVIDLILAPAPLGTNWVELLPKNFEGLCHEAEAELKTAEGIPDETWVKVDDGNRLRYMRNMISSARQAFVQLVTDDDREKGGR